jgi:acylphosphatase
VHEEAEAQQGRSAGESRAYRIEGRVQGVAFRWWSSRQAEALGVRGWVRNLPDGAVELHAGGPAEALDTLEGRLRKGPRGARVTDLRTVGEAQELPEGGFEIRSTPGREW